MSDLALFDLSHKVALVTGGNSGVGRACATALAMGGAAVAIAGRDPAVGESAVAELKHFGGPAIFVKCDVADPEQVEAMIDKVTRALGGLDILVNSAGIYRAGREEELPTADWNEIISVNLTGTWLCARAAMRRMIRQSPTYGKIINIASITGSIASHSGAYGAAKAGVIQLTKTLALQWGRYGINVNSLSPGYVASVQGKERSLEECQRISSQTPLGQVQRLEDLHGPVLFLASQASDYVTGQNLIVDGGHTLSTWLVLAEPRVMSGVR